MIVVGYPLLVFGFGFPSEVVIWLAFAFCILFRFGFFVMPEVCGSPWTSSGILKIARCRTTPAVATRTPISSRPKKKNPETEAHLGWSLDLRDVKLPSFMQECGTQRQLDVAGKTLSMRSSSTSPLRVHTVSEYLVRATFQAATRATSGRLTATITNLCLSANAINSASPMIIVFFASIANTRPPASTSDWTVPRPIVGTSKRMS